MSRWIGRGEVNRQPSVCELDGYRRRQCCFADAAFTHDHNQPMAISRNLVYQVAQAGRMNLGSRRLKRFDRAVILA